MLSFFFLTENSKQLEMPIEDTKQDLRLWHQSNMKQQNEE